MFANYDDGDLNIKLVFAGDESQCRAAVRTLHAMVASTASELFEEHGAVFFDFEPRDIGTFRGLAPRPHIYSFPRKQFAMKLGGTDGVAFFAGDEASAQWREISPHVTSLVTIGGLLPGTTWQAPPGIATCDGTDPVGVLKMLLRDTLIALGNLD